MIRSLILLACLVLWTERGMAAPAFDDACRVAAGNGRALKRGHHRQRFRGQPARSAGTSAWVEAPSEPRPSPNEPVVLPAAQGTLDLPAEDTEVWPQPALFPADDRDAAQAP